MSQLDGSTETSARGEGDGSITRVTKVALPPPPVAGVRTVARLRGKFDESLPTLRLPTLPPRAVSEGDVAALDRAVRTTRDDTKIGRPFSPTSMLRPGPRLLAPSPSARAIRDLVEDPDPEEIDDADLVDDEAASTLVRTIDPASSIQDAAETIPGAPIDAAATLEGAPIAAISDPTPVVHMPVLAVPAPTVLVHAIVGPRPAAPRRRAWAWAVIAPIAVLALAATAWGLAPTSSVAGRIDAGLSGELPQRLAASGITTPPVIATPAIATPVIATPVIATPVIETPPPVIATPVAIAPSIPPAPPLAESAPVEVEATTPAASAEPKRKRTSKRSRKRDRARPPATPPVQAAPMPAATPAEPTVVRRVPAPGNDAAALLREAERAFAEGRFATALHFADRSRAKAPDARAARIAALAACRIGQAGKAKAAYAALPAGQRASVRNKCLERGIQLD